MIVHVSTQSFSLKPNEPLVRLPSNPAGVVTNTAPTNIISTSEKTRMKIRALLPSSSPTISGKLAPPFRIEIIPDI